MKSIGIDLGTKNVLIYIKGKGIVLNEPSVVAVDIVSKKIVAVGKDAYDMIDRTPGKVKAIRPMKDGVIADFDAASLMLNKFLNKVVKNNLTSRPRILICCPSNISQVEKNAIREIAECTKAKKIYIEEEPKVAAIGAGMDITKPVGSMVIDIGGGTTDIAILSLGGIVSSSSIKIAGNSFDSDIVNYVREKYNLHIGEKTAEEIKIKIGSVGKIKKNDSMEITGRDSVSGLPKTVQVTSQDVFDAIKNDIDKIISEIKKVLESTTPEILSDIKDKGIILTGGGSLIEGIVPLLKDKLKVSVFMSDSPLEDVINGTSIMLDNLYLLEN